MTSLMQLLRTAVLVAAFLSIVVHGSSVVKRESHQRPMKLTWVPVVEPKDLANAQSLVIGIQPISESDSQKGNDQQETYGKTKTGSKLVMDLAPIVENNKWSKYGGHNDENRYTKSKPSKPVQVNYEEGQGSESDYEAKPSDSYQDGGKSEEAGQSRPVDESGDREVSTRTFVDTPRDYETSSALADESGPNIHDGKHRPIYDTDGEHYRGMPEKFVETHKKFFVPEEFDNERGAASIHYDDDDEDEDEHTGPSSPYFSATHGTTGKDDDYYGPLEEFEGAYAPDVGHRQASEHREGLHRDDEDGSVGGTSEDVHPVRHNDLEPSRNMFKDQGVGFNSDSSESTDKLDFDTDYDYHVPKMEYPALDETPYKEKSGTEQKTFTDDESPNYRYVPKWSDVTEASVESRPTYDNDKSVTIDTYEDPNAKQPEPKPSSQSQSKPNSGFLFQPLVVPESAPGDKQEPRFVGDEIYIEPMFPREPAQPSQQSSAKSQQSEDPYSFPPNSEKQNENTKYDSRQNYNTESGSSHSKPQEKPDYQQEQQFQRYHPETRSKSKEGSKESNSYSEGPRSQPTIPKPQRQPSYEHEQAQFSIPKPLRKPNYFEQELAYQKHLFQPKPSEGQYDSSAHDEPQSSIRQPQRKPQQDSSNSDRYLSKPQDSSNSDRYVTKPQRDSSNSDQYVTKPQRDNYNSDRYVTKPQRDSSNSDRYVTKPERDISNSDRYVTKPQRDSSNSDRYVTKPERDSSNSDRYVTKPERDSSNSDRYVTKPQRDSSNSDRYVAKPQRDGSNSDRYVTKSQQDDSSNSDRHLTQPLHIPLHILKDFLPPRPQSSEQKSSKYTGPSPVQNSAPGSRQYDSKPERRPTESQQYQAERRPASSRDYTDNQRYEKSQRVSSIERPPKHQGGLGIGIGFLSDIETMPKPNIDKKY